MHHKVIRLIVGLCCILMPFAAHAWTLKTWVKSQGGIINSSNGAGQAVTNGMVTRNYTTTGTETVIVGPADGWKISKLEVDNVIQEIGDAYDPYGSIAPYSLAIQRSGTVRVTATFARQSLSLSATVGPNGSVDKARYPTVFIGYQSPAKSFTFTPNPGFAVSAITASAGTLNTHFQYVNAVTGLPTSLGVVGERVKVKVVNMPGPINFKAIFAGTTTTPDLKPTAETSAQLGRTQCANCHAAQGVGVNVFNQWSTSAHKSKLVMCYSCHVGADSGAHPGPALSSLGNICTSCHADSQGVFANHPFPIGGKTCVSCHNPHTLSGSGVSGATDRHFNNITSGMYPASYVTSKTDCASCHVDTTENATIRNQWNKTGHSDTNALPWIDYDFKTRAGCVQCHTTTGFIAYSTARLTAAWGVASDKTKEVLSCKGCHSNVADGTVRMVTPNKPFADETSYTNRNVGISNICMDCHSGRNNGQSIQVKATAGANFNTAAFVAPHYLSAGGSLHGKSAYLFSGKTYAGYSSNSHRRIGMTNTNATGTDGPCVTCHMSASGKHLFSPVTLSQSGAIAAVTTAVCTNCHAASLPAGTLDAKRVEFNNALEVLKAQLAAKGHPYSDAYLYFAAGNWGSGQNGANVMGAAFNYKLFLAEPGAYAHYADYAKQLITDSIVVVANDGDVNGSITLADALAGLVGNGITQAQADRLAAYKTANSCTSCHANTSPSHPKHLSLSIGCAQCHSQTAATNSALVAGTQTHLNGSNDVNLSAGGSYAAGACSNVYCHSNGVNTFLNPVWGSGTLNCASCHPLAALGGAHAAHIGALMPTAYGDTANSSTTAEYRFGCGSCHPADIASHINNLVDVTLLPTTDGSLRSKNDPAVLIGGIGNSTSGISGSSRTSVVCSAAFCHSNGNGTFVNSPDWYTTFSGDKCAMCHGNAPATGAHAKHAAGIHYTGIFDGNNNLIPAAAPAGTSAGHGDPAQTTTISCDTCHSSTITNSGNNNGSLCTSCHNTLDKGTPILDKTMHLNGSVNVAFKDVKIRTKAQIRPSSFGQYSTYWTRTGSTYKVGATSFDTAKLSLNQATFAGDKSCANVACHNGGAPKWTDALSCVDCHSKL